MSSIVERDFILRLARQLGALLAAVLRLQQRQELAEAAHTLAGGAGQLLGMELRALLVVDAPSAAQLLGSPAKVAVLARVVEELGAIDAAAGRPEEALVHRLYAVELYRHALGSSDLKEAREGLERLREVLPPGSDTALPPGPR